MEKTEPFSLTKLAYIGRLSIKFGGIALVLIIAGKIFLDAFTAYWKATHPPPPPPPTVGFGILPALSFPAQQTSDKPSGYQLQLANSRFPSFGDRAKVFLMTKPTPNLFDDQNVRQVAGAYGFAGQPTILNARSYRWTRTQPLQETLDLDAETNSFSLFSDYLSRPELLTQKNLPSDAEAVGMVKSFISGGQSMPADLATPSGQVVYLKSLGNTLGTAVSFSDADFLQVDIQRTPIDGRNFYTPDGTKGIVHAIIASGGSIGTQIVQLEYAYHTVDYNQIQTYPIRSANDAWQLLQAGEGYIAHKPISGTAVVRDVSMGYYDDTKNEQDYLQPIYVFSGDDGFLGFVSAIDPRYIQTAQPTGQ